MDRTGAKEAAVARLAGIDARRFNQWWNRGRVHLQAPGDLYALARVLEVPYREVLEAALKDHQYLPAEVARGTRRSDDLSARRRRKHPAPPDEQLDPPVAPAARKAPIEPEAPEPGG